jgi:hypothetical protein
MFSHFTRYSYPRKAAWQQREANLVWGAPLVLFPALALVPVIVSLILEPMFGYARVLGFLMVPVLAFSAIAGLGRLAACFRRDFDVITFFAGGTVVVLVVICMSAGVVLASVIGTY